MYNLKGNKMTNIIKVYIAGACSDNILPKKSTPDEIIRLTQKNQDENAMKIIYNEIDELITQNKFDDINTFIDLFIENNFSFEFCTSLLMITKDYKEEITKRNLLVEFSFNQALKIGFKREDVKKSIHGLL